MISAAGALAAIAALLPHLFDWLPFVLGGGGVLTGLLGLVPGLRDRLATVLKWAPWILALAGVLGLLWYRGEYRGAQGELANFRAASATAAVKEKTNATQSRARTDDAVRQLAPADVLDGLR